MSIKQLFIDINFYLAQFVKKLIEHTDLTPFLYPINEFILNKLITNHTTPTFSLIKQYLHKFDIRILKVKPESDKSSKGTFSL